ncbi:hypothetical protein [Pseudomonas triticifolii]|uniref:Transcriptional regulator n=1 Tax=Pseudomonas triticifolii TaxID=2762592 RepID=A0ABR7BKI1_9PSED|nr:hypothetical protein [Pseudomonas triticifolii]MBC3957691.1 hypothetical protein [Pseudomonas triticifolii]
MTDDVNGKILCLRALLRDREAAGKRRKMLNERRLNQAHALALMCLESQDIHPEKVAEALKITDRYIATLKSCIGMVGGNNLQTTATFPEGKVTIDKFSQ